MKIGNVAWGWTRTPEDMPEGDSLLAITDSIAALGFELIDYLATNESLDAWFTRENCRRLGKHAISQGLRPSVLVFQQSEWTNGEPAARLRHLKQFANCAQAARDIGCRMISCILPLPTGTAGWRFDPHAPANKQAFRLPKGYSFQRDWDLLVDGLSQAADVAADHGLRCVVECFPHSLVSTPHAMLALLRDVGKPDRLGIQFDTNHVVYQRIDPEYAVCILGAEHIFNVHIKDSDAMARDNLPAGSGIIDYTAFLKTLSNIRYQGDCSIEVEFTDNPRRYVKQALDHLRLCMAGEY